MVAVNPSQSSAARTSRLRDQVWATALDAAGLGDAGVTEGVVDGVVSGALAWVDAGDRLGVSLANGDALELAGGVPQPATRIVVAAMVESRRLVRIIGP